MNTLFKLSTLTLALTTTAYASETIPTYTGDEIVVTATRTPKPVRELLNDTSVITQEQIAQAGAASLPELLRTQPGIEFTSNGGMGTTSSVFIRGANANHTLVLIDGMRVNSTTTGSTALEKIPLSQIERIEILRGPASHLYGSEAIGGVIQIFTKSGKEAGFNASAGIGSDNLQSISVGGHGQIGTTSFNVQVAHLSTDSFSAIGNPASSYYNPDKDGYRDTSVSGKVSHEIDPSNEIGATAFYSKGAGHYDGYPAAFDSRNEQTLSAYGLYSRNRFLPDWQSLLRLGTSMDNLLTAATNGTWSQIRTDQDQLLWQNDITTRAGLVTLGTERVEQHVTSNTAYTLKQRNIQSYFAGYQGKFDAHSVQLNLRSDANSQYGTHATKSLAYGYQFNPEWRAGANIGTAFSAPTFNELYYPGFGNPNLRPETALNKEVSLHYDHGTHHVSLVHFDNRINDLITYPAPTYMVSQIQRASITGTTLDYNGKLGDYGMHATATWQRPVDEASGLLLNRRAERTAAAGIDRTVGNWLLGGEVAASGRRYDDVANTMKMGGYAVLNLAGSYTYSKEVTLQVRLNNVLDKQYELARTYNTPGRNVFLGVNYQPK